MSEPIRVLFHVDTLALGGLEKKVARLALRLNRGRFEPIVSYSKDWGPCGDDLQRNGVPVHRIVPRARWRGEADEAVGRIRELAPQIFHSFSCQKNADDVRAARQAGTPCIVTSRSNVRYWAAAGPARDWEFDRNAMTDFVIACCAEVGRVARAKEGLHTDKLVVIPNGVEIPEAAEGPDIREELGIAKGILLAGYAAKYRPLKAHEILLNAWQEVTAARPDAFLVCCGEDEENRRASLQEMVCRLGLVRNVMLLKARPKMDSFYRGLDLYVHASRSEGLSNAILEAMTYRLPIVATPAGGTPEAIEDGLTGVLVPCEPPALAGAILKLAESPEARWALGRAAKDRVRERFSLEHMVEEYESLYVRAVGKDPGRRLPSAAAPDFIGIAGAPVLDDVTVFVTTVGDEKNFSECMAHLRAQTVRCRIEVIDHVAPMSAAFAEMHARCTTPYYVQVDEDMMLHPQALSRLRELIGQSDGSVPLVCAPVWDCDVERPLLGIKIYRHEIVKRFPYQDTLSCEVTQLRQMASAGHHALVLPTEGPEVVCLGEHGKHYSPRTIFQRWQRLFQKRNELGNLHWLDPWPERLLERYVKTRGRVHLYAALGAIAGIAGRAYGRGELNWRDTNPAWNRMQYYFPASEQDEE
jgi:glycosyltransferase involved in cell wall biosynthesis